MGKRKQLVPLPAPDMTHEEATKDLFSFKDLATYNDPRYIAKAFGTSTGGNLAPAAFHMHRAAMEHAHQSSEDNGASGQGQTWEGGGDAEYISAHGRVYKPPSTALSSGQSGDLFKQRRDPFRSSGIRKPGPAVDEKYVAEKAKGKGKGKGKGKRAGGKATDGVGGRGALALPGTAAPKSLSRPLKAGGSGVAGGKRPMSKAERKRAKKNKAKKFNAAQAPGAGAGPDSAFIGPALPSASRRMQLL